MSLSFQIKFMSKIIILINDKIFNFVVAATHFLDIYLRPEMIAKIEINQILVLYFLFL